MRTIPRKLTLKAKRAVDLMTPNVLTLHEDTTVPEAATFLTAQDISAALVTDAAARPVGVLSQTDIVKHDCERQAEPRFAGAAGKPDDRTPVSEIMTHVVFSVAPATPASTVVDAMLSLGVHRLFVLDHDGHALGVISALDVLRHLCK